MRVATAGRGDRGALSADFDLVAVALSTAVAGVGVLTTLGEEVLAAATGDADAGRPLAPPDLVGDVADLAAEGEAAV